MGPRSLTLRVALLVFLVALTSLYSVTWPFEALLNTIVGPSSFDSPTLDMFGYPYAREIIERAIRHGADGFPYVELTPELRDYRSRHPKFRFALFDGESGPAVPGSDAEVVAAVKSNGNRPVTLDGVSVLPDSKDLGMGVGNARGLPFVFYGFSYEWLDVLNFFRAFLPNRTQLAVGVLTSLAASWIVARHAMAPLKKATQTISEINADALDRRIPLSELPSEVVPLVRAVNDALARVERGVEAEKRFIANAAHELRTPITILRAHVQRPNPATFQADMERDSSRIAQIVEQLLALATVSGQQASIQERVDLSEVLRRLVLDYAPLAINSGRNVELDCVEEPVLVLANQRVVESVVSNLIDNALRAEPAGGSVTVRASGDAFVEVVDHGEGVAREDRDRIFEPFWRKSSERSPGTGLGLSIAKQMMDRIGGRVWVEETPGGGATFKLAFLPATET